ncbi:DNA cytosine methyltransferase [bacterium]|nr:DNA cytosine methyltransferase [bacterium]
MPYTIGSLCSGYGGLERGIDAALRGNTRTVFYCEREMYAVSNILQKIKEGKMDKAPVFTDVISFPTGLFQEERIDILCGGFPCQSFSSAGKRLADEDPRHLFPHFIRIIEQQMPKQVFLENVEGIISAKLKGDHWADPAGTPVLLHVLRELERRGYKTTWGLFSASEVGAPHQRKRVFILAHSRDAHRGKILTTERRAETNTEKQESCCYGNKWPARPGQPQHDWEPPRTVNGKLNPAWVETLQSLPVGWTALGDGEDHRIDRLRLLGNGVVRQTAAKAFLTLSERLK